MELIDKAKWDAFAANNDTGAGLEIIEFAESWANGIEAAMQQGYTFIESVVVAEKQAKHHEYLEGSQFFYAAFLLYATWKHGEALKDWYNGQHGIAPGQKGILQDFTI